MKKTILIAPEYALADLAESHRMASVAKAFINAGHEVYILGKGRYDYLFDNPEFKTVEIPYDYEWMTEEKFLQIHDMDTHGLDFITDKELDVFVTEEVSLITHIKPDVVITGFRPTMSVSTKITKTPLVWILSASVSDLFEKYGLQTQPHGFYNSMNAPKLISKIIHPRLLLSILKHAYLMPKWYGSWNKIMRKHKLRKFKNLMGLTKGDFNLMSDAPELFPEFKDIPPYYDFCGPLLPEMNIPTPEVLKKYKKNKNRPVIFFSMGSSGNPNIFKQIVYSFENKPYDVFVATTSIITKEELEYIPKNIFVEKYFPAIELTEKADLVIIHGGQGTVYTTIFGGTPFIGIPMFAEQQWNLETAARNDCGIIIPRPGFMIKLLHDAITEILSDVKYRKNIQALRSNIIKYHNDSNYYPPKIAVNKIINFLDKKEISYFDVNDY